MYRRSDLLNNLPRILVLAHADKFGMPYMVTLRPLKKLYLGNRLRTDPNARPHFLHSQALPPSPFRFFRQVDERTIWSTQVLDAFEYGAPGRRHKPGPHTPCIDEMLTSIKPNN